MANILESSGRILVVGDVMLNRFVHGIVLGRADDAPVSVLHTKNEVDALGGASNVANNIAELGVKVMLVGVAGSASPERCLLETLLSESGIEHDLVEDNSRMTTSKTRFMAENGQQLMRCDRFSELPVCKAIETEIMRRAERYLKEPHVRVLVLADSGYGVLTSDVARRLIEVAKKSGVIVVVHPKGTDWSHYTGADLITPNRYDLKTVTGLPTDNDEDVVTAAHQLSKRCKAKAILVTRDKAGMTLIRTQFAPVHIKPHTKREQVIDIYGAGDTVLATLACCLACGESTLAACETSSVAAGIVVAKPGTATVPLSELVTANAAMGKMASAAHMLTLVKSWRKEGLTVGFTSGCFDILHRGHISMLREAASSCDRLIVGINSDASAERTKGSSRPVCNITERSSVLSALHSVDVVVSFKEDTPIELIKAIRPDFLFKGENHKLDAVAGAEYVQSYDGQMIFTKFEDGVSATTTSIIRRILERSNFRSYH